ncbi:MAG TPA: ABC transporter ATP-binding protein [Solirubrobacteraceae bacterium]|nr:ABC transporter ATP-binding protein [Solirubrobacteraceae bacterium]
MSRLTITELRKSYDTQPVLSDVNLDVPSGSLTAVLGQSGCGKTTMLRVLAGFERADHGVVKLGPTTLDDASSYVAPERRGIGYVPQEGALFPNLTVAANVGFGLSRRERRGSAVVDLLELVGLTALGRRFPHELSGGEQQRVALARALARRPALLLLDEPFSSLDAGLRTHMREEVRTLLHAQGVTAVLVTHDQEEALSLADVLAVLRDGRIVQQGTPDELYNQPVDAQLARFLGAANLLSARIEGSVAHTALGELALRAPGPGGNGRPELVLGGPGPSGSAQPELVLLRPEQLEIHPASDAVAGLAGRVERCDYYGHDALLHIRPTEPCGADVLLARVAGEHSLPVDTRVTVAAHGLAAPIAYDSVTHHTR